MCKLFLSPPPPVCVPLGGGGEGGAARCPLRLTPLPLPWNNLSSCNVILQPNPYCKLFFRSNELLLCFEEVVSSCYFCEMVAQNELRTCDAKNVILENNCQIRHCFRCKQMPLTDLIHSTSADRNLIYYFINEYSMSISKLC